MIRTRLSLALLAALALVLAPRAASAQFEGNFAELVFQGGAAQPIAEDGTATSYSVGAGIAYRKSSVLRLGAEFAFNGIGIGGDEQDALASLGIEATTSILEFGGFARYHMRPGMEGPYLKGSLGARQLRSSLTGLGAEFSGTKTVLGYGLAVGWMLPGFSDVATFFEAEYAHAFPAEFGEGSGSVDNVGFDMLKISMGAMFGAGF